MRPNPRPWKIIHGRGFLLLHSDPGGVGFARQPTPPTMTATTTRQFGLSYFKAQVLKTRQFGHTYVHVGAPHEFDYDGIAFTVSGYGRSLQGGGHKYKVHATLNGKPVPSKQLLALA